jgi:glutamate/tyrosine decarboxylase-like PLP-dependent enzyme
LTAGIELADSWTTDGHKWLNTPYDGAMAICRDRHALAVAMNSDAVYATAGADAQKNLTLEFSRRARGVSIWAALRSLGTEGIAQMVDRHCSQAKRIADGLVEAGFTILNRVVLNQILVRCVSDDLTRLVREGAQASGKAWFGPTVWRGRPAFRISVSSWRTTDADTDRLVSLLAQIREEAQSGRACRS